jgi:hypothetical protein
VFVLLHADERGHPFVLYMDHLSDPIPTPRPRPLYRRDIRFPPRGHHRLYWVLPLRRDSHSSHSVSSSTHALECL